MVGIGTSVSKELKERFEAVCKTKETTIYKEIQKLVEEYVEKNEVSEVSR